ncbi:mitotic checkpoint protein MAD1, partial [Haematococcus lacustris]
MMPQARECELVEVRVLCDAAQARVQDLSAEAAATRASAQAALTDAAIANKKLSVVQQAEVERLLRSESAARSEAEAAKARAAAAEARVASLEKEADGLAREVAGLQEKLGRGEFGKSGSVRVLHLRMNPESQYQQQAAEGEMGALRAEVTALRASVGQAVAAGVGVAGLAVKDAEIAVLKHKVAEADKASARLKEVFKERAAAFREAVYLLFGY